jgi:hypothetical protein
VGKGVIVGRGVLLGVTSSVGLEVHVGCNWIGVTVTVGGSFLPGGRKLYGEAGSIKISAK